METNVLRHAPDRPCSGIPWHRLPSVALFIARPLKLLEQGGTSTDGAGSMGCTAGVKSVSKRSHGEEDVEGRDVRADE